MHQLIPAPRSPKPAATMLMLTNEHDGSPILIDPTIIGTVTAIRAGEDATRTQVITRGEHPRYLFPTETPAEIASMLSQLDVRVYGKASHELALAEMRAVLAQVDVGSVPVPILDADEGETVSEYAEDQPDETPVRPGSQHDEDHATDLTRDAQNGL